jgi:hypothetical protein
LRRIDRQNFIDIVKPFIADGMKYKINITDDWENLSGTRKHEKITVKCAVCGKEYERHYKKGNAFKFCGPCYFERRNECLEYSNNNGAGSEFQNQDIVCSA